MFRILLSFLFLFLIQTGLAFSQCIVSDGGDDGSLNQLRDCIENQADAVVDVQVDVLLSAGEITISRDVDIIGAGDPGAGPTIDANFGSRVFTIPAGGHTVLIRNLTILNGLDNGLGGGVGIRNDGGDLTIECSTISGNMANSGSNGGGVLSIGALGSLTITDSTFVDNFASGIGGGVYLDEHTATITNTTFDNNSSDSGGGIYVDSSGILNLLNSTVSGNLQTDNGSSTGGGGIATSGSANITNSTITNNSSVAPVLLPSGISSFGTATVTISGSIVANQQVGIDCSSFDASSITSTGGNIESGTSCGFMSAGDLQDTDPLLGVLANNGGKTETHILLPGSPAIDNAGTCGLADDQRGEPREADACDTGSVEVQKATLTITKETDPTGLLGFSFSSDIPDENCTPMLTSGEFTLDDDESISCTITEGDYNITEANNTHGTLDFTTLAEDTAVDCTFTNIDDSVFSLNVVLAGPGNGTVTGPTGVPDNGGIDCPGDCTESYNPGTNVTLNATAAAGSEFQEWTGDCNASGEVTINGNRTCTATFKLAGGGDVLNPGDPLEFIQDNVPEVNEGGEGTFIVTARNATDSNLTNVEISIEDEIVVSREIINVRLEPSTAFLEPNIGSCLILENSVECDIASLANDVDIVIDFVAEDVSPGDIVIFLTGQADQFGGLVNAIALVIVNSGDSGCTVAAPGTSSGSSMLLFLLIPAGVIARRILRKKK